MNSHQASIQDSKVQSATRHTSRLSEEREEQHTTDVVNHQTDSSKNVNKEKNLNVQPEDCALSDNNSQFVKKADIPKNQRKTFRRTSRYQDYDKKARKNNRYITEDYHEVLLRRAALALSSDRSRSPLKKYNSLLSSVSSSDGIESVYDYVPTNSPQPDDSFVADDTMEMEDSLKELQVTDTEVEENLSHDRNTFQQKHTLHNVSSQRKRNNALQYHKEKNRSSVPSGISGKSLDKEPLVHSLAQNPNNHKELLSQFRTPEYYLDDLQQGGVMKQVPNTMPEKETQPFVDSHGNQQLQEPNVLPVQEQKKGTPRSVRLITNGNQQSGKSSFMSDQARKKSTVFAAHKNPKINDPKQKSQLTSQNPLPWSTCQTKNARKSNTVPEIRKLSSMDRETLKNQELENSSPISEQEDEFYRYLITHGSIQPTKSNSMAIREKRFRADVAVSQSSQSNESSTTIEQEEELFMYLATHASSQQKETNTTPKQDQKSMNFATKVSSTITESNRSEDQKHLDLPILRSSHTEKLKDRPNQNPIRTNLVSHRSLQSFGSSCSHKRGKKGTDSAITRSTHSNVSDAIQKKEQLGIIVPKRKNLPSAKASNTEKQEQKKIGLDIPQNCHSDLSKDMPTPAHVSMNSNNYTMSQNTTLNTALKLHGQKILEYFKNQVFDPQISITSKTQDQVMEGSPTPGIQHPKAANSTPQQERLLRAEVTTPGNLQIQRSNTVSEEEQNQINFNTLKRSCSEEINALQKSEQLVKNLSSDAIIQPGLISRPGQEQHLRSYSPQGMLQHRALGSIPSLERRVPINFTTPRRIQPTGPISMLGEEELYINESNEGISQPREYNAVSRLEREFPTNTAQNAYLQPARAIPMSEQEQALINLSAQGVQPGPNTMSRLERQRLMELLGYAALQQERSNTRFAQEQLLIRLLSPVESNQTAGEDQAQLNLANTTNSEREKSTFKPDQQQQLCMCLKHFKNSKPGVSSSLPMQNEQPKIGLDTSRELPAAELNTRSGQEHLLMNMVPNRAQRSDELNTVSQQERQLQINSANPENLQPFRSPSMLSQEQLLMRTYGYLQPTLLNPIPRLDGQFPINIATSGSLQPYRSIPMPGYENFLLNSTNNMALGGSNTLSHSNAQGELRMNLANNIQQTRSIATSGQQPFFLNFPTHNTLQPEPLNAVSRFEEQFRINMSTNTYLQQSRAISMSAQQQALINLSAQGVQHGPNTIPMLQGQFQMNMAHNAYLQPARAIPQPGQEQALINLSAQGVQPGLNTMSRLETQFQMNMAATAYLQQARAISMPGQHQALINLSAQGVQPGQSTMPMLQGQFQMNTAQNAYLQPARAIPMPGQEQALINLSAQGVQPGSNTMSRLETQFRMNMATNSYLESARVIPMTGQEQFSQNLSQQGMLQTRTSNTMAKNEKEVQINMATFTNLQSNRFSPKREQQQFFLNSTGRENIQLERSEDMEVEEEHHKMHLEDVVSTQAEEPNKSPVKNQLFPNQLTVANVQTEQRKTMPRQENQLFLELPRNGQKCQQTESSNRVVHEEEQQIMPTTTEENIDSTVSNVVVKEEEQDSPPFFGARESPDPGGSRYITNNGTQEAKQVVKHIKPVTRLDPTSSAVEDTPQNIEKENRKSRFTERHAKLVNSLLCRTIETSPEPVVIFRTLPLLCISFNSRQIQVPPLYPYRVSAHLHKINGVLSGIPAVLGIHRPRMIKDIDITNTPSNPPNCDMNALVKEKVFQIRNPPIELDTQSQQEKKQSEAYRHEQIWQEYLDECTKTCEKSSFTPRAIKRSMCIPYNPESNNTSPDICSEPHHPSAEPEQRELHSVKKQKTCHSESNANRIDTLSFKKQLSNLKSYSTIKYTLKQNIPFRLPFNIKCEKLETQKELRHTNFAEKVIREIYFAEPEYGTYMDYTRNDPDAENDSIYQKNKAEKRAAFTRTVQKRYQPSSFSKYNEPIAMMEQYDEKTAKLIPTRQHKSLEEFRDKEAKRIVVDIHRAFFIEHLDYIKWLHQVSLVPNTFVHPIYQPFFNVNFKFRTVFRRNKELPEEKLRIVIGYDHSINKKIEIFFTPDGNGAYEEARQPKNLLCLQNAYDNRVDQTPSPLMSDTLLDSVEMPAGLRAELRTYLK